MSIESEVFWGRYRVRERKNRRDTRRKTRKIGQNWNKLVKMGSWGLEPLGIVVYSSGNVSEVISSARTQELRYSACKNAKKREQAVKNTKGGA